MVLPREFWDYFRPRYILPSAIALSDSDIDSLSQSLVVTSLESLVIDEADLILSYGHDEDVRQIFSGTYLPKVFQSFLMSATMTEDVEMLKGLALRNPASLDHIPMFTFESDNAHRQFSNLKRTKTRLLISANTL